MNEPRSEIYEFGDFRVDAAKRLLLRRDGEPAPLTPKAFETLLYLVQRPGKTLGKEELMRAIWADTIVEENNLNQNISILRRILGETRGENRYIATVPGAGYRFVADVRTAGDQDGGSYSEPSVPMVAAVEIARPGPAAESEKKRNHPRLKAAILIAVGVMLLAASFRWLRTPAPVATIGTIAVLPFKPLVAENRNEALELGMADTLINRLSASDKIVVRPMTSIRRFGGLEQDSLAAGRELRVDSVLDGSIQTWGDRIRISARLVRVQDGRQLWSGQFDEKFTDIFGVQDSISERVAAALVPRLGVDERRRLTKHDTDNIEAYQLYLKGAYHAAKMTGPEIRKGLAYYQQAIDLDPGYALAYASLAYALGSMSLTSDVPSSEAMLKAKAAALKAIEIDESLAAAYVQLGMISFWYEWDWAAAERNYQRALELAPNDSGTHLAFAHLYSNTGRHDQAIAEGRRARELDSLALSKNTLEAQFLFFAGRSDEAIDRLNKTFELNPNFWVAHLAMTRIYIARKMYSEALAAATKARDYSGGTAETTAHIGYILGVSGKRSEARAVLEELQRRAGERYVPPYSIALVHNGLDERDETLNWLEKAYEERDVRMTFLKIEPKWDNLRSNPRFLSLVKRLRLD